MRLALHLPRLLPPKRVAMCAILMTCTAACGQRADTPVSPTAGGVNNADAAADGSTLKATTPAIVSPTGGGQVTGDLVLTASKSTGKFTDFNPSYQFQVRSGSTVVYDSGVIGGVGAGSNVTHTVPSSAALNPETDYTWRVRAVYQGAQGSWSGDGAFKSPVGAYINGNEVRDPLTIGRSVGDIVGPAQFVSKGLELLSHESHVSYVLPQTLEAGEFSVMVTGIDEGSPGVKTKVMSMQEGFGDITTNDYRLTIEKRGSGYSPAGAIQFRMITGDSGSDDSIADSFPRSVLELSDERWYLWQFRWHTGFAELNVRSDTPDGPVIFHREVATNGHAYRPMPHVIHLGAPVGRAGPSDASIPGAIYKNVWVGPGPRPAFGG